MRLADCIEKHQLNGCWVGRCFVVYPKNAPPVDLWVCDDYIVSSVAGGCIWLKRRG